MKVEWNSRQPLRIHAAVGASSAFLIIFAKISCCGSCRCFGNLSTTLYASQKVLNLHALEAFAREYKQQDGSRAELLRWILDELGKTIFLARVYTLAFAVKTPKFGELMNHLRNFPLR